jgi:hypothetical protein
VPVPDSRSEDRLAGDYLPTRIFGQQDRSACGLVMHPHPSFGLEEAAMELPYRQDGIGREGGAIQFRMVEAHLFGV